MFQNSIRVAATIGVLALSAGLVACSGSASKSAGQPVTVVATDMAFQPKEVRIGANQPVTVRLQNKGKLLHDWSVEQVKVSGVEMRGSDSHATDAHATGMAASGAAAAPLHVAAEAGHSADVAFTALEPGEFVYYCTVPGHREAGMEGRLIVA